MSWEKLKPIKGDGPVCRICACGSHDTLSMKASLGVGFGDVTVTKDGREVYSETKDAKEWENLWTAQKAENMARKDPDHDWRIWFFAPLYEAEYQRQGDNHWVLVKKGLGFA